MELERLAPELLCSIQCALDSPQDLYYLIKASPASLHAFVAARRIILSSVVQNALSPEAIPHALAILHIPKTPPEEYHHENCDLCDFLDQYLRGNSWSFPKDLSSVITLARLIPRVSGLIDEYFDFAMKLPVTEPCLSGFSPPSSTEWARLQIVFLRFEIFYQIFPMRDNSRYHFFAEKIFGHAITDVEKKFIETVP
ncbi:hypothetical protein F4777DRAFT_253169 [Nemania sp. FL0916]|nr:hypothetical protein F4777DRAFT_253169 [Nemania sp. FL0916]